MDPQSFVQKVATTIRRHGMADPEDRLLVGVSGGADSVCLVRVLGALGYRLGIAHVDHGLRGADSDADARFVGRLAARLGVPFFVRRIGTGELSGNIEAAARNVRRAFLRKTLRDEGFRRVALGHSRDDRTETFFLHLLRGSGSQGLASMAPVDDWMLRPLVGTTRLEIEAYLAAIDQPWRTDATNRDLKFARNRVRHEVLPRLAADFNPRLGETLARTVEILAAENAWMDQEAAAWLQTHFSTGSAGPPRLDLDDLGSRPVACVRRVLRAALRAAGSDLQDIGFDHLERVRRILAPGKSGKTVELPGPIHVERSFDTLVFRSADPGPVDYEYDLPIPGRVRVREAGLDFEARVVDEAVAADHGAPTRVRVDGESLGPCVKIRNWRNGDTYDPAGLPKSKLKTLFQDRRIPRSSRRSWPVFVARSSIVWVASFPVSGDFAPTERSRRIIEFEACPSARRSDDSGRLFAAEGV